MNTILTVLVVIVIVGGLGAFVWWRTKVRDEAFAEAAKMLGGKVEGGGIFSSPQIVFTKDGIQGVIELGRGRLYVRDLATLEKLARAR